MKILDEMTIIVHRNGKKEYFTKRKYILMKMFLAALVIAVLSAVISLGVFFAFISGDPHEIFRNIMIADFGAILFTGLAILIIYEFLR